MKLRRRRSWPSSTGSASVDLELPRAPCLALLLALHGTGLPLYLVLGPLHHGIVAAAGCLLLAALAAPTVLRLCLAKGARAPRRLRFTLEGRFNLELAGGYREAVAPAGRSLIAGPWWLLILEGIHERHYVLLETFQADPARLAALGRCLRRVAVRPGAPRPALRSLIEPGRPGV